jgi:hypothetical protein
MCIVVNITNINNRFQVTISDGVTTCKYPALKKKNDERIDEMIDEFFFAQRISKAKKKES